MAACAGPLPFPSAMFGAATDAVFPKPRTVPMLWVRGRDGRVLMAERGHMIPEDVERIARFL